MHPHRIIDCHLHSGVQNVSWGWEEVRPLLLEAGVSGAGVIPPVEDVYDRYDPRFQDSPEWQACRGRAHQYLLALADAEIHVYPYFFVWNDFAWEALGPRYVAVKWHRHPNEPHYRYDDPRCREFLKVVRTRKLPILLEESFENTLFFLDHLAGDIPVIIPHLGALSGGYRALRRAEVFARPNIYADTALCEPGALSDYLSRYGSARLMFGSDYPFGHPAAELAKVQSLNLAETETRNILGDNFRRLCGLGE
jgi:hypothetical protein